MLKDISWKEYLLLICLITTLYYVIVMVLYYRRELSHLLISRQPAVHPPETGDSWRSSLVSKSDSDPSVVENENYYTEANRLIAELSLILDKGYIREELILALQLKLQQYMQLKPTPFGISIMNYIESECEKRSIPLSEEDLRVLW